MAMESIEIMTKESNRLEDERLIRLHFCHTPKFADELVRALHLWDIIRFTTIDMTQREKSLLDLLIEQSGEKRQ